MINNKTKIRIKNAEIIFWDFDGVIKDSVPVKGEAFRKLFNKYGKDISEKVVDHHYKNGGVSRYEKIRFYHENYLNKNIEESELISECQNFSDLVIDEVINCNWVKGVENYLRDNPYKQTFYLVTGTPHEEIMVILKKLNLLEVFNSVHGSPEDKISIIKNLIIDQNLSGSKCIMIGDSYTDFEAARRNNIDFVFRSDDNVTPDDITTDFLINNFNVFGL
jgi:phosphoglycolate phosphatase-like HAD superfamily hydrolase